MIDFRQLRRTANDYIEQVILPSDPRQPLWNSESRIFGKPPKWNYIDNCMLSAALMLFEKTGDTRLSEYILRFADEYVSPDGSIPTLCTSDYSLDNINGGRTLIWLYKRTSDERFCKANELLAEQLRTQPRLNCGSFFHKAMYPYQIWLDGAYMALPFMAELGLEDDVCLQLRNMRTIMRDAHTGLYYHGYDETRSQAWADPVTGLSREFWLRSMGWLCAGLADIYGIAAPDSELGGLSGSMLADLLHALTACITDSGMLMQLPARPELDGNYPESSGSLLFAYSALKASRLGAAGKDTAEAGMKVLSAVADQYITYRSSTPVLGNICLMAGLGGTPCRDGSAGYYLSERIVENDAKGIAPLLMAISEAARGE